MVKRGDRGHGARAGGFWSLDGDEFAREQARSAEGPIAERRAAGKAALERAALEVSGEIGYAQMTVERLISRSGANRVRFYSAFSNKDDCYGAGYAVASEQICARLLAACAREEDWAAGMLAALRELIDFMTAEPALARGILTEVDAVRGAALAKRKEVFERLSRAIDRARRETDQPRHSSPPITSAFILGGIEAAILKSLKGEDYDRAEVLPAALYLSVALYFGPERAKAELRRAGLG